MRLVDERIVTEPPGGDTTGLLRSAELDIECHLSYFRWIKHQKSLEVYTDGTKTQLRGSFTPDNDQVVFFDVLDQAEKPEEYVEGTCIPVCKTDHNGTRLLYWLLILAAVDGKYRRTGLLECQFHESNSEAIGSLTDGKKTWWDDWDINKWDASR
ncbi:uncharacterized protein GGS22DRAFT_186020 [Annulohypoxylon maeteangense]|uniref:uncharacterized protein n=1 Tax=Annulohypoxylon maeteangense TaxID=1927788 RepID=UPI002007AF1B|nr:uncharacterized protein GGS22DRAFT_186020 [Annulohypoxylon maeteangense]KAI0887184.1 hypothetical protein GGS22DRAFT_186020 [Annulohypoxylon maeteangense]